MSEDLAHDVDKLYRRLDVVVDTVRQRVLLDMARQLDELADKWSWHTATGIRLAARYVRGQASDSAGEGEAAGTLKFPSHQ